MTRNQLEYWKNVETERHNRALEAQGLAGLEIQRMNTQISAQAQSETARSNRARELETYRSNLAREANELARNQEAARSNQANEQIRRSELAETITHNRNMESIQSNNSPWTTFATTIAGLFSAGDNPTTPNPITNGAKVFANDVSKGVTKTANMAKGVIDHTIATVTKPPSAGILKNGVTQLPTLNTYVAAAKPKPSVNNNNPVKVVGRKQTLVTKRYSR